MTLNISGPSIGRAERLLGFLRGSDADVLVLTETRHNAGTRLLIEGLESDGWFVTSAAIRDAGERGVAVAQRAQGKVGHLPMAEVDLAHRLVLIEIALGTPLTVVGAYVPSRDTTPAKIARKQLFLRQLTEVARQLGSRRFVLLGDLNIVGRDHVPRYAAFRKWEYDTLEELERAGLVDAHLRLYPGTQVHSWIGRKGAGYRYDYAFVSPDLKDAVQECLYLHEPRVAGLTDHAAVLLTLNLGDAADAHRCDDALALA